MPMTDKTLTIPSDAVPCGRPELLQDERIAALASSYLDGELEGQERIEFEILMRKCQVLSREIEEMRRIDHQLMELGADILNEPIPESLLDALSRLNQK